MSDRNDDIPAPDNTPIAQPEQTPAQHFGFSEPPKALVIGMNVLLTVVTLAAAGTLAMLYAFGDTVPWPTGELAFGSAAWLHFTPREVLVDLQLVVLCLFAVERVLRAALLAALLGGGTAFVRRNLPDFAAILVAVVAVVACFSAKAEILAGAAGYIFLSQLYDLASPAFRNLSEQMARLSLRPFLLLMGSAAFVILTGSILLMLKPGAISPSAPRSYYIDALFTATAALCGSGQSVRNVGLDYTPLGQAVVLALMQIGGLATMAMSVALACVIGRRISPPTSPAMGYDDAELPRQIRRWVRAAVAFVLVLEVAGAAMLYPMFTTARGTDGLSLAMGQAVWHSVFHSVSAVCNCGITLYGDSLESLRGRWQMLGVVAPLVVLGGLGLPVLGNICGAVLRLVRPRVGEPVLSTHTLTVLVTSVLLIAIGAGVLTLVENNAMLKQTDEKAGIKDSSVERKQTAWESMTQRQRFQAAVFQSVSARGGGFRTIEMGQLSDAGKMTLCGLMLVGGSPGSTAGGMRTVTLALLLVLAVSLLRGRHADPADGLGRLAAHATSLAVLYLGFVALTVFILCVAQKAEGRFLDLCFEACSACGASGLSTGLPASLNAMGKSDLIGATFFGKLGPLAILTVLARSGRGQERPKVILS